MKSDAEQFKLNVARARCEEDHLFFTRYFFLKRQGIKFKVNWHHRYICDAVDKVLRGEIENLVITVPPGSSKTELVVINLIARGLALNPRARFLHLSGSDSLASLNSATARDIVKSDAYQEFWPYNISTDADSKKRWNVEIDGQPAGGVYATSLGGQITGFRAGHMAEGFQGAIIIDDPIKPEDAYSKVKLDAANRKLLTTIKSRKANPKTPIIVVMQRIAENDTVGFIKKGNVDGKWTYVNIPAVMTPEYVKALDAKYSFLIEPSEIDPVSKRQSYWPYKEPLDQLLRMERGEGQDASGARVSKHVFNAQYNQSPVTLGGNIIKGQYFGRYTVLPKIKYRKIFADTASKTKERNDYSVFECWGLGADGKIYLLDVLRGKWEAPELLKRAQAFWAKHKNITADQAEHLGALREMIVEDKSSGTGLIQTLSKPIAEPGKPITIIPIKGIERSTDKFSRVNDVLAYIEAGSAMIPLDASFTNDFVSECEAFTADDTHDFDDQLDPMIDAINDMLSTGNIVNQFKRLASPVRS